MDNIPVPADPKPAAQVSTAANHPAPDPLVELERLRELNRRWRRTALIGAGGFVFLLFVSLVQFLATMSACKLLHTTREEMKLADIELRRLSQDALDRSHELRQAAMALDRSNVDAVANQNTVREILAVLHQQPGVEDEQARQKRQAVLKLLNDTLEAQLRDGKRGPGFVRQLEASGDK
jgi:hypothetical protein